MKGFPMSKTSRPITLTIDIGGTNLKAGLLSPDGRLVATPVPVRKPHPATPDLTIALLEDLVRPIGEFQRISIGFPGPVRNGQVLTAPNLDVKAWRVARISSGDGYR
jgi:polyphosphate glucokinase